MDLETFLLILISVCLGVAGQISLKYGIKNLGPLETKDFFSYRILSIISEGFVLLGISFYLVATFLWLIILSKTELSSAYPMLAIGYILIALLSKILLNENLTILKFVGIILISIGVFMILKS